MSTDPHLSLRGPHPYYPDLGEVRVRVELHPTPPGVALRNLGVVSLTVARDPNAWTPLTTEYQLTGHAGAADCQLLLALLWDLAGGPIHPRLGPREAVVYAVVMGRTTARTVEVWRRAADLHTSVDDRAIRERDKNHFLPDARKNAA